MNTIHTESTTQAPYALVTGATGFVGKALCKLLLEKGWRVRAAVRDIRTASQLLPRQCDLWECGDLAKPVEWSNGLTDIDYVFHLAAHVHQKTSKHSDSHIWYLINETATEQLALAAAKRQVKRFVYVSTIKVNGEVTYDKPFTEEDPPNPQDDYAKSKWAGELAIQKIGKEHGLDWTILRPPLVYGEGAGANYAQLVRLVKTGIPLPFASIKNKRSLVHVDQLVQIIWGSSELQQCNQQIYLVAAEVAFSLPALIKSIAKTHNIKSRLFPLPPKILLFLGNYLFRQGSLIEKLLLSLEINSNKLKLTGLTTTPDINNHFTKKSSS